MPRWRRRRLKRLRKARAPVGDAWFVVGADNHQFVWREATFDFAAWVVPEIPEMDRSS